MTLDHQLTNPFFEKEQVFVSNVTFKNVNMLIIPELHIDYLITKYPVFEGFVVKYFNLNIVTSVLINESTLPKEQYDQSFLNFNPLTEKAMLIRNSSGDYAILKADAKHVYRYSFEKQIIRKYDVALSSLISLSNPEDTFSADVNLQTGTFNINLMQTNIIQKILNHS